MIVYIIAVNSAIALRTKVMYSFLMIYIIIKMTLISIYLKHLSLYSYHSNR